MNSTPPFEDAGTMKRTLNDVSADATTEAKTKQWYADYYEKHGVDRNDLLTNPEVLLQAFAFDRANIRALRHLRLNREEARILDVGCGSGQSLLFFLRLGFRSGNLAGVDVNGERIAVAMAELPNVDFRCESATNMSYDTATFDLVCESTMFVQLTDEQMAREIAREMVRVTKPGGFLLLTDWRYGKPGNPAYRALSKRRIADLFGVGSDTVLVCTERGALIPPVGRVLSRWAYGLYFLFQAAVPFAVGQTSTVLQKKESAT